MKGILEQLIHPVVCPVCGAPVVMGEEWYDPWTCLRDADENIIPYRLRYCVQPYVIKWKKPQLKV